MILVVGSGIAGLWTALSLARGGQSVTLVTKGSLTDSNTWFAQGGVAAALEAEDTLHFQDTLDAGAGLCDPQAVKVLVEEGPLRVRELMEAGFLFDREGDRLALGLEGAHSRRRILHAGGDATGARIEDFLARSVRGEERITLLEKFPVYSLLKDEEKVWGVVGRETLLADAVVLATGGAGALYSFTTNPPGADGAGIAMAYRAGAVLTDLEFMQFHPTCLHAQGIPPFLISEAVRGEGAVLRNEKGEAFMEKYHAQADLAPRDIVSRAIFQELRECGEKVVWLDLAPIGKKFPLRFPTINAYLEKWGIPPSRLPVAPAAHYFLGGIRTDLWGRTNLEGLYAVGEVAATGVHGANRLASNSLLEGMVFAHRAAQAILGKKEEKKKLRFLATPATPAFFQRKRVQETMDRYVGLIRDRRGLLLALSELEKLEENSLFVELAKLMTRSALWREESRGGHFRSDFPQSSENFESHFILKEEETCRICTPC